MTLGQQSCGDVAWFVVSSSLVLAVSSGAELGGPAMRPSAGLAARRKGAVEVFCSCHGVLFVRC